MKLLHIYKTEPDDTTTTLVKALNEGNDVTEVRLYDEPVDYDLVLKLVFENDRSISW